MRGRVFLFALFLSLPPPLVPLLEALLLLLLGEDPGGLHAHGQAAGQAAALARLAGAPVHGAAAALLAAVGLVRAG